jgi:integrase
LKRAVLAYAREVLLHPHESLAHPSLTLKQAYHRFYNVLRMCGVTRGGLGVTAHGLRHEYANDLYESVAGVRAPLRGGAPADAQTDGEARMRVVHDLGHGRKSISSAYLGGLIRQGRLTLAASSAQRSE